MLAITDGHSVGSNLVLADEKSTLTTGVAADPNAEKRRSNILRSREFTRKTSARGARSGSRGAGGSRQTNRDSVFERLAQAA